MIKAVWQMDYDFRADKTYKCPMHEECGAPIMFYEGKYICIGCGEEAELDPEMKNWIDERSGEKVEVSECMQCGQKTMSMYYHKNPANKKWEVGHGECTNCGCRFIV